jgi:hypothetical protein
MTKPENQEIRIPTLEDMFSGDSQDQKEILDDPLEGFFKEEKAKEEEEKEEKKEEVKVEKDIKPTKLVDDIEPKEVVKPKKAPSNSTSSYSELVKDFIEEGDWEDGQIEIDGKTIILSEMEDIDKDTFYKLKAGQKSLKEEKNKDKYISSEGLDETGKKLIDLIKLGGDVSELIQYNSEVVHPLKDLDLSDVNIQKNIVFHKYKAQGLKDTVIHNIIKDLEAEFKLDEETEEAVQHINQSYNSMVEEKLNTKKKEVTQREENIKIFGKNLNDKYKEFGLKDSISKNLTSSATTVDKQGWTKTDALYFKAKSDPEFYSKLNYMLNDPKAFEEFMGTKTKNKAALETLIKISSIDKKAGSTAAEKPENKGNWDDYYKD